MQASWTLTRYRYEELRAFCRQYPEKKAQADAMLGVGSQRLDGMPHGNTVGDPVSSAALRREKLLHDTQIIETCAGAVDGGRWYVAIMLNVCFGKPYRLIPVNYLPTSHREGFYRARRMFFMLLDQNL